MKHPILSPDKFATEFNRVVPGAYRSMTAQDIRDLTSCGLIGRYGYYGRSDIETVRAILEYERLQRNRLKQDEIKDSDGAIHCRRCGVLLVNQDGKRGRPTEYCPDCQPLRGKERYRKWRKRKQAVLP